jgi:hypothetical protein
MGGLVRHVEWSIWFRECSLVGNRQMHICVTVTYCIYYYEYIKYRVIRRITPAKWQTKIFKVLFVMGIRRDKCLRLYSTMLTEPPTVQSESELLYNWRSVSQYVLVSSPIWDSWPEIIFFLNYSLVLFGAPSLTRGATCRLANQRGALGHAQLAGRV